MAGLETFVSSWAKAAGMREKDAVLAWNDEAGNVGNASATFNLSDTGGAAGAAFVGQYAGPKTMTARYNGMAPGGTEFVSLVAGLEIDGGSYDITENYGNVAIGVPVSDMSMQVEFSLTPGDKLGGNVVYRILPEPAAGLLALWVLALVRRR